MAALIGHLGPGILVFLVGFLKLCQACRLKWIAEDTWRIERAKVALACIFIPPAVAIELYVQLSNTHTSYLHVSETSKQHMVMYAILGVSAIISHLVSKRLTSLELLRIYDPLALFFIGVIFGAHNMGAPLFVFYHQFMGPLTQFSSVAFFLGNAINDIKISKREAAAAAAQLARLFTFMAAILLMVTGSWFMDIGVSFYAYGENAGGTKGFPGVSGGPPSAEEAMKDRERIRIYLCVHFVIATVISIFTGAFLRFFELSLPEVVRSGSCLDCDQSRRYGRVGQGGGEAELSTIYLSEARGFEMEP